MTPNVRRRVRAPGLVLLVSVLFVVSGPGAFAVDPMWDTAVDTYPYSREWVPFEYEMEQRQYNGRGNLVSHSMSVSNLVSDGAGGWDRQVIAEETFHGDPDGGLPFGPPENEDTERDGDNDRAERFAGVSASPLDPRMQDRVVVSRLGRRHIAAGGEVIAYHFELRPNTEARAVGTVFLDADTGMLRRIERTVDPPIGPVKSFLVEERFEPRNDHWIGTGMTIDVTGRLLFVERQVEMEMAFRAHRHDPEAAAEIYNGN